MTFLSLETEEGGRRRRRGFLSTGSISLPVGDSKNEESWLSLSKLRQPLPDSPRGCRDLSRTTRKRNWILPTTWIGPEAHSFQNLHRIAVAGQHFDFGPETQEERRNQVSPPYQQNCDWMNFLLLQVTKWVVICHGNNIQGVCALLASRTVLHLQLFLTFDFPPSGKAVLTARSVTTVCVSVTLAYICILQRYCRFSSRPPQ